MKRFDPVSRYPLPSADRSARHRSAAASEPLEASVSAYAPSHSAENSRGRYRAFSSSVPNRCTPCADRWWTDSVTARDRKEVATSSSTARYVR